MFNWFKKRKKTASIAEIAEAHRARYMEFLGALEFKMLGSAPELLHVYTDMAGNNYYVAKNSWQGISRERLAALEAATTAMEHRFTRAQALENWHKALSYFKAAREGNTEAASEGYTLAWEVFEVTKKAPSEQILMEYAVHVIFTDGENPETLSPAMLQIKRQRATEDAGLRAFFLDMAQAIVSNSLPILEPDGQTFLEEEQQAAQVKEKKKADTQAQLQKFMKAGKERGS